MMHGREKSDLVIVAMKPVNKAERSAAELVEPRVGTKGRHKRWPACGKQLPFGPEVGAVCGKAARTDLRGGREVTRVPTAKETGVHCPARRRGASAAVGTHVTR
jgi:hypothetical protein